MDYSLKYYDLVLGAIILSLALGGLIGTFTPVRMPIAIVVLGAVAVGFMGHALFVNGPVDDVDDLSEEVEDAPIKPNALPLLE